MSEKTNIQDLALQVMYAGNELGNIPFIIDYPNIKKMERALPILERVLDNANRLQRKLMTTIEDMEL